MIVALFPPSFSGGKGNNIVSCEKSIFLLTNDGNYTPLFKNFRIEERRPDLPDRGVSDEVTEGRRYNKYCGAPPFPSAQCGGDGGAGSDDVPDSNGCVSSLYF